MDEIGVPLGAKLGSACPNVLGEAFVVSVSPSAIVILPGYSSAALLLIQFSLPDSEEIAV